VIASATETEITTDIVSDLLPPEQFFRFNPRMEDMPIDEVRKERLDWLKTLADEYFEVREAEGWGRGDGGRERGLRLGYVSLSPS